MLNEKRGQGMDANNDSGLGSDLSPRTEQDGDDAIELLGRLRSGNFQLYRGFSGIGQNYFFINFLTKIAGSHSLGKVVCSCL